VTDGLDAGADGVSDCVADGVAEDAGGEVEVG
jgi:hypothetical protein